MKVVYLFLCLALAVTAHAQQDFCKLIKKEVSDNKVQSDFSSPFAQDNIPPVRAKRSISTDEEYPFDTYTLIFLTHCGLDDIYNKTADGGQTEKVEKKLIVTFEDNSRFADDTTEIAHDFSDDRTEAMRIMYLQLTPDGVTQFSTKKITKFTLAGQERLFPADSANALMQYVKCMKTAK